MVVLDTHAWIWWMSRSRSLSAAARNRIEASGAVAVATISCWEVGLLASTGRIELELDPAEWVQLALAEPGVVALPLQPAVAVAAAALPAAFPRDSADRMIYATARSADATLITKDRRLRDFDPRGTLW